MRLLEEAASGVRGGGQVGGSKPLWAVDSSGDFRALPSACRESYTLRGNTIALLWAGVLSPA